MTRLRPPQLMALSLAVGQQRLRTLLPQIGLMAKVLIRPMDSAMSAATWRAMFGPRSMRVRVWSVPLALRRSSNCSRHGRRRCCRRRRLHKAAAADGAAGDVIYYSPVTFTMLPPAYLHRARSSDSDDADAYAIDTSNTIYCLHVNSRFTCVLFECGRLTFVPASPTFASKRCRSPKPSLKWRSRTASCRSTASSAPALATNPIHTYSMCLRGVSHAK